MAVAVADVNLEENPGTKLHKSTAGWLLPARISFTHKAMPGPPSYICFFSEFAPANWHMSCWTSRPRVPSGRATRSNRRTTQACVRGS